MTIRRLFRRLGACLMFAWLAACAPSPDGRPPITDPVRIALHGDPSNLDPHLQSEEIALSVLGNVYEGLVSFGPNMRIEPQIAESWSNPSDLVWRFRLRRGLTFHDGRPLTAQDVLASVDRVRHHPRSRQAGALVAVETARLVDDHTVELVTVRPYPILLNRLAFIFVTPRDAPEEITEPIGSGPYRFVSREAGRVTLEAERDHWRIHGHPDRAEYHFVADSMLRSQGLLAGTYDLVDDMPREDAEQVRSPDLFRFDVHPSQSVAYLQLDVSRPPFDDPKVRRALSLAIDRQALVDDLFGGLAEPVSQMVSQNVFGHQPALRAMTADPEAAGRLLAEAGYPDGFDMELEVRSGREDPPMLVEQLAAVGVRLRILERPWGEMYARLARFSVRNYLGAWVCTSGDAGDVLDRKLHSRRDGYGDANFNGYSNPELDALIEKSNTVLDLEARQDLLQQALETAAEDLPYIPLYSRHDVYGASAQLEWSPRQDSRIYAFETRWSSPRLRPVSGDAR